ncbi:uncharacterized protein HMPREF1541_00797 [Cyphellophora europaea CBS 101466]|uniref:Autophagy-related protein 9 n=1 Tax=Cyphellophora europaea (strain CBS 101466) TaxID=1220924 RepID=W2SD06_CYPE1|nr:uncharacterized protein HMPREF1541_00797 [Cyphellophora europaea CBS 101466]ETN46611.1 hypothetical protein HMPREF1541_00797 [Cyphellophora europaea CBS 101466]
MAANILSRWRSSDNPAASIYETIREHDQHEDSDESDVERQAGLYRYGQQGDGNADLNAESTERRVNSNHRTSKHRQQGKPASHGALRPKWMTKGQKAHDPEDLEDDVPASLLIEGEQLGLGPGSVALPPPPSSVPDTQPLPTGIGDIQTGDHRAAAAQSQRPRASASNFMATADPRAIAMYRWSNVVNLDNFLLDLYDYYDSNGIYSILLRRLYTLLTGVFIVGFSTFLTQCIDYHSDLKHVTHLKQVLVPKCMARMSFFPKLLLWVLTVIWIWKLAQYLLDIRRLLHLRDFYLHLLDVNDSEIQSISWQEIVSRLMALRDANPAVAPNSSAKSRRYATTQNKQRMDAHDIANRLLRKENYIIAMINKDILDMTLPVPFLRNRQLFTRTLEWNLNWCIMDFIFNDRGQLRPIFLKDTHRKELSEALRRRFIFAGTTNLIAAPFLIIYFLLQNFFTNFNEYQRNPGAIGSREYNPLAEWKFREFNELRHLFRRRMNMSHPFASRYIDQFPKDRTVQTARFVAFITGALTSVLVLATLLDQENLLAMAISDGRTTLFYLGLFGGIWAVARGMIPEDNLVYEPTFAMQEVIDFTHYHPSHWKDRLHTVEVKREFEQLYQMKILILAEEVLSMVFTPFVLWFSLPKCSDRIVDFFREFTVHVDGIGYVCSFAEFKFTRPLELGAPPANPPATRPDKQGEDARDDYFASKDHKLEQSYWGFMNDYSRNPKADVRFHYHSARKRVPVPPPVPGLPSPILQGGFGGHSTSARANSVFSPPRGNSSASQFMGQTMGTPLQSMLLDPHHQPAAGFAAAGNQKQKAPFMSQLKAQRRAVSHPAEVREEDEDVADVSQPNDPASTGQLGSWKYDDEQSETSDEEDEAVLQPEGVVGLIRRLQKTQSEGDRGAGIRT